jgi:hypothetical protein
MDDNPSFWRNPKWQIVISVIGGLLIYIFMTWRLGGSEKNSSAIILDVLLFYSGFIFWFFFFSQFVLPVQRISERKMVFERLFRYLLGEHGPAIFIESGELKEHGKEMHKDGPGIALLDAASAAMLRTAVRFTQPIGPGVAFTGHNPWVNSDTETVASTVDLHHKFDKIGPYPGEDPFAEKKELDQATNKTIQDNRFQTSGLTRDGIEIVPTITIFFKIDTQPGRGNTQFGYNEEAVRKACIGEGIDPESYASESKRKVPWNKLPGLLAADLWREALVHFTLDDLFRELSANSNYPGDIFWNKPDKGRYTGLEFVDYYINQLMTQEKVSQIDTFGRVIVNVDPFGRVEKALVPSEAYKNLHDRGVRVEKVVISDLHLSKEIEEQIERQWESTWLQRAKAERELLDQQFSQVREKSRQAAQRDFANAAVQYLRRLPPGIAHSEADILKALADGTLSLLMHDGLLRKRGANEKNLMIELLEWLQRMN